LGIAVIVILIGGAQTVEADAEKQSENQQSECSDKDTALHLGLSLQTVGHSLIQNFWQRAKRRLKLRRRVDRSSKEISGLRFYRSRDVLVIDQHGRSPNTGFGI
jgi:hypothetical protein